MNDPTPLSLFPDTNVLVQGRALKDQPWGELGRDDIDVILCGPVIRELDRLKTRPGRVGKVARAISTKVRELMRTADRAEILRGTGPRVVLRLAAGPPNQAAVRVGLDLSHDDQAIINQVLASKDGGADAVLLTDDNFAAMTAEHFGLPVQLLPAHWLKEPETDDGGKEIARRDAEIARLKAAEPVLGLRFVDSSGAAIERLEVVMKRYQPVAPTDVDRLVERISNLAPKAAFKATVTAGTLRSPVTGKRFDVASVMYSDLSMIPVTKTDFDRYEADYKRWLSGVRSAIANVHVTSNRRRKWPVAGLCAINSGSRPADDVLLEISASGNFQLSGPGKDDQSSSIKRGNSLEIDLPPAPPISKSRAEMLLATGVYEHERAHVLSRPHFPAVTKVRRNDDEFYWREGRSNPLSAISLECKTWRHGRAEEDFPFRIWATDETDVRGLIVGRVSASNIGEPLEARMPVRISFVDCECLTMALTLVDDLERRITSRSS